MELLFRLYCLVSSNSRNAFLVPVRLDFGSYLLSTGLNKRFGIIFIIVIELVSVIRSLFCTSSFLHKNFVMRQNDRLLGGADLSPPSN